MKELAEKMEGDLTMKEIKDALFMHMNISSSHGIDGLTVKYDETCQ